MKMKTKSLYMMVCLLLIWSLMGCGGAPVTINQEEVTIVPYRAITDETVYDFHDVMGFDGYCLETLSIGAQILRNYFAKTPAEETLIASTFGFPDICADYFRDIDGDGTREIVANVCFGDGAQRVEVWRLRDGTVEVGRVDQRLYDDACAVSRTIKEKYDHERNQIRIRFSDSEDDPSTVIWEWDDFSHFVFEPFDSGQ